MKSPFTGGEAILKKELRTMHFRKEPFEIWFQFYKCKNTGEQFTTDALDMVNTNQVYNQYRAKYGIPFSDEIKAIREQYGLSAHKMSEILGLGTNVYRNYEAGEVPSVSNGRLVQLAKDPREFKRMIDLAKNMFTAAELEKINLKTEHKIHALSRHRELYETLMLGEKRPSEFNGYRVPDMKKVQNVLLYFATNAKPFKTKMNKLLFYSDFYHFKNTGYSITGLTYQAIQKGPVPRHYDWIFDQCAENKFIMVELRDFGEYMGEQILPAGEKEFDEAIFSTSELNALDVVTATFKKATIKDIVNTSHEEKAWNENVDEFKMISYNYAFELKKPE